MLYRIFAASIFSTMLVGFAAAQEDRSLIAPYIEHITEAHADVVSTNGLPPSVVEAQRKLEDARRQLVNAQQQVAEAKTQVANDAAAKAEAAAKAQAAAAEKVKQAAAEKAAADAKAAEAKAKAVAAKAKADNAKAVANEASAPKPVAEKVVTDKTATDKATADKVAADKTPGDKPEAAKSSLQDPVVAGSAASAESNAAGAGIQSVVVSDPPVGKWDNFNSCSCGAIACDVAGGCDMPGGCSVLRNRPIVNGIKNRISDIRRPLSGSCASMGCDGCDSPGGGCQLLKKMHNRLAQGSGPIRNVAKSMHRGVNSCDMPAGCDMPVGCDAMSVQDGPIRRIARSFGNRGSICCEQPCCIESGGCDLPGGCGGVLGNLRNMNLQGRRPVRNMLNHMSCDSTVCDAVGGCDQPGGCQLLDRIHNRMSDGPVRQMIRSRNCGLPGCDMAGGCDMPGGCDMMHGGLRNRARGFAGLFRSQCTQDPGVLFYWSAAPSAYKVAGLNDAIVTDRPDFTEASSVVGLGVLQMEVGYTYTFNDNGPGSTKTSTYPETLIRYGMLRDWLEFRLNWSFQDQEQGGIERDGADDLLLGFKFGLTAQHGILPEMALITQLRVPTGASTITRDEALPGMNLIYGWNVNDFISVAGSTQFNRDVEDSGDAYTEWAQSFTIGYTLDDRIGAYTEYFGLYPHSSGAVSPENYFNAGLTYLINNDVQWDFRYGVGLDNNSDDYFVGSGLSFRLR